MRFRLFCCSISLCVLGLALPTSRGQSVVINEVMAANTNTLQDEDGTYSDWVELFNPGVDPVDLTDWGLTDLASNPFKWRFGAVTIQPGQFLIVWASNKNRPIITATNMLHTSFAISKGGEDIVLTRADSNQVDMLPSTAMTDNQSVGRQPDGTGAWLFFAQATPGTSNTTTGVAATLTPPEFSVAGGVYTSAVSLAFSTTVTGGVVRYTLDGSEPTSNSALFSTALELASRAGLTNNWSMIPTNEGLDPGAPYYEGWQAPLGEVFKVHTVRARVFKSGSLPSSTITQSYLVDTNGTHRYTLPILSIASDPSNFFSAATGIYVPGSSGTNYMQDGSDWERPASVEMIDTNGLVAFRIDAGIRINGNTTRNRPRKALRVYARNPTSLAYPLFPEKPVTHYDTFLLRNGGNDWGQTLFRDAYMQSLVAHTGIDRQSARPVVVFLDGEYWGVHQLRDRLDEGYLQHHYGLAEQDFVQMESGWVEPNLSQPIYDRGNTNWVEDYYALLSLVNTQSMATAAAYEAVQDRMDVDNYADYLATEIWSGNTDWPGNNVRLWRSVSTNREPGAAFRHDGRWRWMLCDMDFGLGLDFFYVPGHDAFASFNSLNHASTAYGAEFSNNTNATLLFRRLLENTNFQQRFVTRFSDHLNSSFRADRVLTELSNTVARMAPEMTEHANRWRQPGNWSSEVARVNSYAAQRTSAVWGHLQNFFGLDSRQTLTLRVNDATRGSVSVNSLELKSGTPGVGEPAYPWSGSYFPDYPVTVTATAAPGYRFAAWRRVLSSTNTPVLSTNATFSISVTNATELRADFDVDLTGVVPQPHDLALGPFAFTEWLSTEPAATYPSNMVFEQVGTADPGLATDLESYWVLGYGYSSQSRVNGLGANGVAFINTGSTQALAGAGYLGSAIVGLTTSGRTNIQVAWTGGTVTPNVRVQGLRLQVRVGASGAFSDVLDEASQPVEYLRDTVAGHSTNFSAVRLPDTAENQPYVQLRWKYYWVSGGSGARAQLRLDDITITSQGAMFAPEANAGADQELTLAGGEATFDGGASSDSDGPLTAYAWSQLAGPALTLTNSTNATLTVSVPAQSTNTTYGFQLVVTDHDGLSATDTVSLVQQAVPLVATYPQMYFRGTPNGWSTTAMALVSNYTWEITAVFGASSPRYKFDVYGDWSLNFGDYEPDGFADQDSGGSSDIYITQGAGTYVLRFNDQTRQYWAIQQVPNQAPTASAGADQTVPLSGGPVTLDGSASYDADGSIASYQWTHYAGPTATLAQATDAVAPATLPARATPVTNRFRLVVTDNEGLSATSTVQIAQLGPAHLHTYSRMFFRGTPNAWSTNAMTLVSNYVWEISIDFGAAPDERFKFDATTTWAVNFGDNEPDGTGDLAGSNILVTDGPGLHPIRFNDQTLAYSAVRSTGVFASAYTTMSLSGTFNHWTTPTNLTLVADYLWQGVLPLFGAQNLNFVPTGHWASAWGDLQPPETVNPVQGVAEAGAPSIVVTSNLSGVYRVTFHETTGVYRIERLDIRAGATNRMTAWEQAHNLDLLDPAVRDADDDADGLSNLGEALHDTDPVRPDSDDDDQVDGDEVVAATDPNAPASRFELWPGADATLNWPGAVGRTYRIEALHDLDQQNWQPASGFESLPGSNGTMNAILETTPDQQHLRVRITGVNYQAETP